VIAIWEKACDRAVLKAELDRGAPGVLAAEPGPAALSVAA